MILSPDTARAWVDVDLGALVANARALASVTGSRLLPMVKANGYGLGAAEVAGALESIDPWGYGVATVEEGAELRRAGIARPILVASPMLPEASEPYLAHDLRPAIGDPEALAAWCRRSSRPFHLELDTGMHRAGIPWDDAAGLAAVGALLADAPGFEGVFTHFHSADSDPASTEVQWARFEGLLAALPRRPPLVHAANSAAALRGRRYAGDLIRPGIFLYGGAAGGLEPAAVAAFRARVLAVRTVAPGETVSYGATWRAGTPTRVATIAAGYADGFPRATRDCEPGARPPRVIEIGGRAAPVLGRVTMDMTMVAVEGDAVAAGDVATLYGGLVSLDQQARAAGTISYELLTGIGSRVPRRYRRAS
ncbi:MAG TPA: alanine racemase [Gemmatimonadales bacterium]|jgi:alanine racemase|nr:alanine racemase [Gemmatimonadales bacterium]